MKTIRVVAAIIHHQGTILATQRGYGEFAGGWEFPGGKIEPNETPEEAIIREIQEELGATIAPERLITTVEYDYPTFHLSMDCFLAHVVDGHLHLTEHSAARWLDALSLDSLDWLPADIAVVEAVKAQGIL
ncbi:MAG: (deoxy)nucleoside triphosphate pyrophosphohydrolase [Eggerthellales bacterium]|nr:(deoxy)nucleoside triphosphate pyrophosphohydrolase [Eggerthellales bacterium]